MGWGYRRSVPLGPFRVNLSTRGLGLSAGIPGIRVGSGPRGSYIHVGGGGLHYRARLGSPRTSRPRAQPAIHSLPITGIPVEIESADVSQLVDTSSDALLKEIAEKHAKIRFAAVIGWSTVLLVPILSAALKPWTAALATALLIVGYIQLRRLDASRKTVTLDYGFDPAQAQGWSTFEQSFLALTSSRVVWHLASRAQNLDLKRSAGASQSVSRQCIGLARYLPRFFKCNVIPAVMPAGKQQLYFFPDRILVFHGSRVGAVPYSDLQVAASTSKFVEEGAVPTDSVVVGQTWKYINKSGGPDRRFKDNRQIPVVEYGHLRLTSASGLQEEFQTSRRDAPAVFAQGIQAIGHALAARAPLAAGDTERPVPAPFDPTGGRPVIPPEESPVGASFPRKTVIRQGVAVVADEAFEAWSSGDLQRMLRALPLDTNPVDRHFLLMNICEQAYRQRKVDPQMRQLARDIGRQHLSEFPNIVAPLTKDLGVLPRVPTFQNLATILAEDGDVTAAVMVCEQAISFGLEDGTKGGFAGRIARLRKRQKL